MGDDPMALLGLEGALKHYYYYVPENAEGLLLQLTQLKQLTSLNYVGPTSSWNGTQTSKVSDGG
jgi:hypothetical protein